MLNKYVEPAEPIGEHGFEQEMRYSEAYETYRENLANQPQTIKRLIESEAIALKGLGIMIAAGRDILSQMRRGE